MATVRTSGVCWRVCASSAAGWAVPANVPGAPPGFDAERYKERNTAERCIDKLKGYRAMALRTDKRERIYQGTLDVASIRIWLRDPVQ
ncbi:MULTISPECIES: hypothetical protein [unclassified Nonomuraea]|uniref:hypothetical protein n=1 Tax=unclassified Nonomuraea TaxID=2593643 RepID=UPI0033CD9C5E